METFKNYCSVCLRDTNHKELFREKTGSESHHEYHWNEDYLVVKCMGCDNVSFRTEYCDEDSRDPETGEMYDKISLYPSPIKGKNPLSDSYLLPHHVEIAYRESLTALGNNCRLLAAAGFRAVIEAVCNNKEIKGKNIEKKINNLHLNGFLSKTEASRLHRVRFLGNDSIHEIDVPSEDKLNTALKIIEHLLSNLYIIDKTISDLDGMIENYSDFEDLLGRSIYKFEKDTIWQLRKVLGKHIRRFTPENFQIFENQLKDNIKNNPSYSKMAIGEITKETINGKIVDVQNYLILAPKPSSLFW